MKVSILWLVLLLQTNLALGASDPVSDEDWLREGFALQARKYYRLTSFPHPERKGIAAVHCEREDHWWGWLRVVHRTGDRIDWIAEVPDFYRENHGHYLLSCDWRYLRKQRQWILEVFDSTHRGNGSLWLFALEGQKLRLLLQTRAVDQYNESEYSQPLHREVSEVFKNGRLNVKYRVPKGDRYEAVYLSGEIIVFDDDDKELSRKPHAETWKWNPVRKVFTRSQPSSSN